MKNLIEWTYFAQFANLYAFESTAIIHAILCRHTYNLFQSIKNTFRQFLFSRTKFPIHVHVLFLIICSIYIANKTEILCLNVRVIDGQCYGMVLVIGLLNLIQCFSFYPRSLENFSHPLKRAKRNVEVVTGVLIQIDDSDRTSLE